MGKLIIFRYLFRIETYASLFITRLQNNLLFLLKKSFEKPLHTCYGALYSVLGRDFV
jgi:hypothetical protein